MRDRDPSGRTAATEINGGDSHPARRARLDIHAGDAEPSSLTEAAEFRRDVMLGLRQPQKRIPSKYFYDEAGSTLFDRICELDEYYVTRTEMAIMGEYAPEMAQRLGAGRLLIEYGSGTSTKTYRLLEHLPRPAAYAPIDVAEEHLLAAAERIARDFPGLAVLPICADFTQPFAVPHAGGQAPRAVYFPGSTIGNFTPAEAARLLRLIAETCGEGGSALIGVDLRKPLEILGPAYDDPHGVTAAFNLNVLRRANRELGTDFDEDAFRHAPRWNEAESRIEMHLESTREQSVCISGEDRLAFALGETILTEYSHKFTLDGFAALARFAGLQPVQVWTDPQEWFAVFYLEVAAG